MKTLSRMLMAGGLVLGLGLSATTVSAQERPITPPWASIGEQQDATQWWVQRGWRDRRFGPGTGMAPAFEPDLMPASRFNRGRFAVRPPTTLRSALPPLPFVEYPNPPPAPPLFVNECFPGTGASSRVPPPFTPCPVSP